MALSDKFTPQEITFLKALKQREPDITLEQAATRLSRVKAARSQGEEPIEAPRKGFFSRKLEQPIETIKGAAKTVPSTIVSGAGLGERLLRGVTSFLPAVARQKGKPTSADVLKESLPEGAIDPVNQPQKIGFFGGEVAQLLIPGRGPQKVATAVVKKIGTRSKVAEKIIESAGEALIGGGTIAVQEGDIGRRAAIGAGVGAAVPAASKAVNMLGNFLRLGARSTGKALTGRIGAVLDEIVENPRVAERGFKKPELETLDELAKITRGAINELDVSASRAYRQAIEELPETINAKIIPAPEARGAEVIMPGKKVVLDLEEIAGPIRERAAEFTALTEVEKNVIDKAVSLVNTWDDATPQGINSLAISIGKLRRGGEAAKTINSFIDSAKRGARDYLGEKIPEFRPINESFAATRDFTDALRTELSFKRGTKTAGREGVIRTSRKIAQLFNSNKELTRQLVKELEERAGVDIVAVEAGRQLAGAESLAGARIGDAITNLIKVVIPESAVGRVALMTGIAREKVAPFVKALNSLAPAERALLFAALEEVND